MKRILVLMIVFLFISLLLGYSNSDFYKERKNEDGKKTSIAREEIKKGGIGCMESGGIGGVLEGISIQEDVDFIKKQKKIIELRIEHLEIRATETIPLGDVVKIEVENGTKVKCVHSSTSLPLIEIELTPTIIEKKGIEILIKIFHERKVIKEETIVTKNLEPFIVELLKKKDGDVRIVDKVIPFITLIEPAKMYPEPILMIKMDDYRLLLNDRLIMKGGQRAINVGSEQIFLFFYINEKGIFVLSFKPFEGAEPHGIVRDNIIKIKHNKDYFEWISKEPILPEGKWLVWVKNNPKYSLIQDDWLKYRPFTAEEPENFAGIATGEKILKRFFK